MEYKTVAHVIAGHEMTLQIPSDPEAVLSAAVESGQEEGAADPYWCLVWAAAPHTAELILQRAEIVDEATDTLERMLNSLEALPLTGEKGQAIIPLWIDEYRTYLGDRRNYTAQLRESGENLPFYETANQIPISERLATFAADNEMPACKPPLDLDI